MDQAGTASPLVSVVVPVYNGDRYLRESLDSILGQTYRPVEVIVIDDASTDDTPGIIASYGSRIRSIRQPANAGTFENSNRGISLARGEFIAIYHADDVYTPGIVEREVEFLRTHPEAGAVFCLDVLVDAENREYGRLELPGDLRGRPLLQYPEVLEGLLRYKNRFLMCPGAMVRRSTYDAVGAYRPERFGIAADLDMWLRIARRFSLGMLEEHLFRYRHFHGNWSQRYNDLRVESEEFFAVMDSCLGEDGRAIVSAGSLHAYEGHRAEDRLRIGVNRYIRNDLPAARAELSRVGAGRILMGSTLQRVRLLFLLVAFRFLSRLPRSNRIAELFRRRWHGKRSPLGSPAT